ncbi:hypothetical protein LUZ60_004032 [Juncus effusus]|nr:hypothetical protein LUZ60_004032 [Juncus effusus]
MEVNFENLKSDNSIQNLPQTLISLIGFNEKLTPNWIQSVSNIINELQSDQKAGKNSFLKGEIEEKMEGFSGDNGETEASVSHMQDELSFLNAQLNKLTLQRREALNEFLDLKGNIRVFCRIRPFLSDDNFGFHRSIFNLDSQNLFLKVAETKSKKYNFDKVFLPSSTQEDVFCEIEPVIKSAIDGYNICIFAYGQTGTGKTYTMEGRRENPGVVPRGIKSMFKQANERNNKFIFNFSMLEIYMGNLRDLLAPNTKKSIFHKSPPLIIKSDPEGGIEIENLISIRVDNFDQVNKLYELGTRFRSTASTMANSTSSRSHCLIRIVMTCLGSKDRRRERNKIWMIDLGGSERLLKTQATGKRLEEGKAINLSLSALADVIDALQTKKPHIPFRNSKLTQVLSDSLGNDSKTLMMVHVSPNEDDLCETICTLNFATRVKSIPPQNQESIEMREKKEQLMSELETEIKRLELECQEIQTKIRTLNEKIQQINGIQISDTDSNFSFPYNEEIGNPRNSTKTLSKVPSFMKPTVSSRRKTGLNQQICLNNRRKSKPPIPKKMKTVSVYEESLISPINDFTFNSEYGSECSSVAISEYEVKNVIFHEEDKSPRDEFIEEKEINNWLHVQMAKKTSGYNQWNKRVMAFPIERWNIEEGKENIEGVVEICGENDDIKFGEEFDEQSDFIPSKKNGILFEKNEKLSCIINHEISNTEIKPILVESIVKAGKYNVEEHKIGKNKILQILETIRGCAILGLGIQTLALEQEFFDGLIF